MRDFATILLCLLQLEADGTRQFLLLTVQELAELLGTTTRNIDYWRISCGFPEPIHLHRNNTRYWSPAEVRRWVELRQRLEQEAIAIEGVSERTGLSANRWTVLIKAGRAPKPIAARQLGTGKRLWRIADVEAWRQQVAGGYRFPRRGAAR